MKYDYQKLYDDLSQLLATMVSFTPAERGEVQMFLDHNEYGLAFETICLIIVEQHRSFPVEAIPSMRELASRMKIESSYLEPIVNR